MRILVTGGAGFVGSNLCQALLDAGHEVIALDNLITGSTRNLDECDKNPRFSFIERSTEDLPDLDVEAVFHLASPASPVGYGNYPLETLSANSDGTLRVLQLCVRMKARLLFTSTSEIYGEPLEHPQRETYFGNVDPVGPRSCYDEGKRFSEALIVSYRQVFGIDARIVRIFNCYGPHNDLNDGRMVPTFIRQALLNQPISVFGAGDQTRSLCYVSDLVRGLQAAMFTPCTDGGIYNLGNPEEHTILEYATLIREICDSSSPLLHLTARDGEISRRRPDISKARSALGWFPVVDVREGLRQTVEWSRSQLAAPAV